MTRPPIKTALVAINDEGKKFRISVDLQNYEIEECEDKTCVIYHMWDENKIYCVNMSFEKLHMLVNGFNINIMN